MNICDPKDVIIIIMTSIDNNIIINDDKLYIIIIDDPTIYMHKSMHAPNVIYYVYNLLRLNYVPDGINLFEYCHIEGISYVCSNNGYIYIPDKEFNKKWYYNFSLSLFCSGDYRLCKHVKLNYDIVEIIGYTYNRKNYIYNKYANYPELYNWKNAKLLKQYYKRYIML